MLTMLLLQAALQAALPSGASVAGPPVLGPLDRQALPARGCAAYLWSTADRSFVAVAGADPASLRLKLDGRVVDLPRVAQAGQGGYGMAATTTYGAGTTIATLALTIAAREDLTAGAAVPQATLTLRRDASDELVQPVAGLIGCGATP